MKEENFIPDLDWSDKVVRDPVHGIVKLTKLEEKLISTSICSRMRDIHQLGFVYLSYTGANHTRFEHCVGTMKAADKLFKTISFNDSEGLFKVWAGKSKDRNYRTQRGLFRQALRVCGLLHDIGHPPYSHTCENLLRENAGLVEMMEKEIKSNAWESLKPENAKDEEIKKHFAADCECLKQIIELDSGDGKKPDYSAVGDHETYTKLIVQSEHYGIREYLEKWALKGDEHGWGIAGDKLETFIQAMAWLSAGKCPPDGLTLDGGLEILYPIATFIDGDLDVDKIDYVARDNYHCGFPYQLDWTGLKDNICVKIAEKPNKYQLSFDEKALFFVVSVIQERYNFGYNLHNETWNTFIERNIVRKLKKFFDKKYKPTGYEDGLLSRRILDMHTKWQDGDLRTYLQDLEDHLSGFTGEIDMDLIYEKEWKPTPMKELMAKRSELTEKNKSGNSVQVTTIREDARIHIGFDEMTPPVRKMVHVLGQPEMRSNEGAKECLDKIAAYFNETHAGGKSAFVVHFYSVNPLKFTSPVHGKSDGKGDDESVQEKQAQYIILDNQIIRGIMNESLKQFGVCVLGIEKISTKKHVVEACKKCGMFTGDDPPKNDDDPDQPHYHLCIKGHNGKHKELLDQIITCYRGVCHDVCAENQQIIFGDLILCTLRGLKEHCKDLCYDVAQDDCEDQCGVDTKTLYNICSEVAIALAKKYKKEVKDVVFEKAKFKDAIDKDKGNYNKQPIDYAFQQELRTCVYIGLIDAERDVTALGRYKPFRRRYSLSMWGDRYFVALDSCDVSNSGSNYTKYREDILNEVKKIFMPVKDETEGDIYYQARENIRAILKVWWEESEENIEKYCKNLEGIKEGK